MMMPMRPFRAALVSAAMVAMVGACKPSDILNVPPPSGVQDISQYQSKAGAELLENDGVSLVDAGFDQGGFQGLLQYSEYLSDEFVFGDYLYRGSYIGPDARITAAGGGLAEPQDDAIVQLMKGRVTLLSDIPLLKQYEPPSNRAKIGMAYALMAYSELLVAEDFCAGLPLGSLSTTGPVYGTPLTQDSLLGVAQTDFDSALANAAGDPTVLPLASVGYARTLLNRGNFTAADTVLHNVPTSFAYFAQLPVGGYNNGGLSISDLYDYYTQYFPCSEFNPASGKGQNGLNYTTANDARLVFTTSVEETCDGTYAGMADSVYYLPLKFGVQSTGVPLATGVEARLIEAEAALHAGQINTWASALNTLRANLSGTYLNLATTMLPLPADSTTSASSTMQVNVMFREKAFWLFGTGTRLGDMRRLVRQYGRDQSTVFPVGPFPNGTLSTLPTQIPNYGTDVNLSLPTPAGMSQSGLTDPNNAYKGCIDKSA